MCLDSFRLIRYTVPVVIVRRRERKVGSTVIDMTGMKFGRLTVLRRSEARLDGNKAVWHCICECGTAREVLGTSLRSGQTTSCGCYKSDWSVARFTKHGMETTPTYTTWQSMLTRCHNPKNKAYSRYGGRGIVVCDKWRYSFINFYKDMGTKPDGMSLDRIDNDGNYEPGNCRWADAYTQANNKSTSWRIEVEGRLVPLSEGMRLTGRSWAYVWRRRVKRPT